MSSSLLLSMDDDIVGIDVLNEDDDIDSIFDDGPASMHLFQSMYILTLIQLMEIILMYCIIMFGH